MTLKRYKYKYRFILIIILVLLPVTQRENAQGESLSNSKQNDKYPSVFPLTDDDKDWIEDKISSMSLYDKCAQMIMAPAYRSYLDVSSPDYDSTMSLVREHNIGGLKMFQGDLEKEINFIKNAQKL